MSVRLVSAVHISCDTCSEPIGLETEYDTFRFFYKRDRYTLNYKTRTMSENDTEHLCTPCFMAAKDRISFTCSTFDIKHVGVSIAPGDRIRYAWCEGDEFEGVVLDVNSDANGGVFIPEDNSDHIFVCSVKHFGCSDDGVYKIQAMEFATAKKSGSRDCWARMTEGTSGEQN